MRIISLTEILPLRALYIHGLDGRTRLVDVMLNLDPLWNEGRVDRLLEAADRNRDGKLQYKEFVDWVRRSPCRPSLHRKDPIKADRLIPHSAGWGCQISLCCYPPSSNSSLPFLLFLSSAQVLLHTTHRHSAIQAATGPVGIPRARRFSFGFLPKTQKASLPYSKHKAKKLQLYNWFGNLVSAAYA